MVENNIWTTPTSRDWKGTTITKNHSQGFNKSLANDVLKMPEKWPTPRSCSEMAATLTDQGDRFPNLETVVALSDPMLVGGKLNPMWVEWLIGFPLGWTDLKPLETHKSLSPLQPPSNS
jgi:hypothetical protein